jgi:hypothetical protein
LAWFGVVWRDLARFGAVYWLMSMSHMGHDAGPTAVAVPPSLHAPEGTFGDGTFGDIHRRGAGDETF